MGNLHVAGHYLGELSKPTCDIDPAPLGWAGVDHLSHHAGSRVDLSNDVVPVVWIKGGDEIERLSNQ